MTVQPEVAQRKCDVEAIQNLATQLGRAGVRVAKGVRRDVLVRPEGDLPPGVGVHHRDTDLRHRGAALQLVWASHTGSVFEDHLRLGARSHHERS